MNSKNEDERDTKENTPSLYDVACERIKLWLQTATRRIGSDEMAYAKITFEVSVGEVSYLEDDTPCFQIRVSEECTSDDFEGWHDAPPPPWKRKLFLNDEEVRVLYQEPPDSLGYGTVVFRLRNGRVSSCKIKYENDKPVIRTDGTFVWKA